MKRYVGAAAAACAVAALATGCGGGGSYASAPPRYGDNGTCWFADSPAEVIALKAAGLCPSGWAAAPMPVSWRNQYAWYYDSPTYYDRYVPSAQRTTYVQHVKVYVQQHPQAVTKTPRSNYQPPQKPASSFRSGTERRGGDAGTSRMSSSSSQRSSGFSSGTRPSTGGGSSSGGSSSFRSGSRR